MSRQAIVQGEVHAAETDKRALIERDLEEYDAVFVEGRRPTIVVRDLTLGYAVFLAGYVSLMWIQAAVGRIGGRFTNRIDLRAEAERRGVAYADRIDADTVAIYGMVPLWARRLAGGWLVTVLAVTLLVGINRLVLVAFVVSLPYLYTTICVVAVKLLGGGRAGHMAEQITTLAEERSYDRIAVLCGDAHREDVGAALEDRRWSVTTHRSQHPLRRLLGG
ncbi:MAG: hypothetical protein PPP58_04190 [Natronomonas sp.]